ncbi:Phosphoglucosamine mutase [Sinobacterium norvegicum]|uniref:phosphomannomutase n=1 Tax=Sinobacterium norvegicum TaxID=1641715 RepID=A0ABM9AIT8_9GAMM|nr:phosphomannomutase/phosphoglucomutase [Sinobacterium norvegicum]CAH0993146.1 Phosphoglucosamine mutase [Sinobacterium norvegicum]
MNNKKLAVSPFLAAVILTPAIIFAVTLFSFRFVDSNIISPYENQQLQLITDRLGERQIEQFDMIISALKNDLEHKAQSIVLTASNAESIEKMLQANSFQAIDTRILTVTNDIFDTNSRAQLLNNIEGDVGNTTIKGNNTVVDAYFHDEKNILLVSTPVTGSDGDIAGVILTRYSLKAITAELLSPNKNIIINLSYSGKNIANNGAISSDGYSRKSTSQTLPKLVIDSQLSSTAASALLLDRGLLQLLTVLVAALIAALSLVGYLIVGKLLKNQHREDVDALQKQLKIAARNNTGSSNTASKPKAVTPPASETATEVIPTPSAPAAEQEEPLEAMFDITEDSQPDDVIFRAYDIRGNADKQLQDSVVKQIGQAIGSAAQEQGEQSIAIASDGRLSSPRIKQALIDGLCSSGIDVVDIGELATPLLYFTTHNSAQTSGVMITGSHNPAADNGLKVVINQQALHSEQIAALQQRIIDGNYRQGTGELSSLAIEEQYIDFIASDIAIAQPLKLVIDCGNGIAGKTAPALFEALNCEVIPLYCEVDGNFPNHHPDPSNPDNLKELIASVKANEADLGIAFDGDGDRLGVVNHLGQIINADKLLMLFAQDVVSRNPGTDVVFDVKCTRHLNALISSYGGRPIMWKSGHSLIKDKMHSTGALLGGEFTGHFFFKERWFGFDDGLYSAARLVEILSTTDSSLDSLLTALPSPIGTAELIFPVAEEIKFTIIDQLINTGDFSGGKITTIDGVRVDFSDGWGLVRASNTGAALTMRFEGNSQESIERIQQLFKEQLLNIENSQNITF